jgi:hypothetical protein
MFENSPELGPKREPTGALLDVDCPHSLRFSDDGCRLLVASAGAPFVHVYAGDENGAGWYGERLPIATFQVMADETFLSGRSSPEEGGPKGLDLSTELNLLAVTCEAQPLAFFDLAAILAPSTVPA